MIKNTKWYAYDRKCNILNYIGEFATKKEAAYAFHLGDPRWKGLLRIGDMVLMTEEQVNKDSFQIKMLSLRWMEMREEFRELEIKEEKLDEEYKDVHNKLLELGVCV